MLTLLLPAAAVASEVLLVISPGMAEAAFVPWTEALVAAGHTVHPVSFPCAGQDLAALGDLVAERAEVLDHPVVAAHGVGALVALSVADRVDAAHYVFLGPTLAVGPAAGLSFLAEQELGATVPLDGTLLWRDQDVAELFLGDPPPPLTCLPRPFAEQVQSWLSGTAVPLELGAIDVPVWVGVSQGDNVAGLEAVVPASRALQQRRLVRFGINRLDPEDFSHGQLLSHKIPLRAAVRAVDEPLKGEHQRPR